MTLKHSHFHYENEFCSIYNEYLELIKHAESPTPHHDHNKFCYADEEPSFFSEMMNLPITEIAFSYALPAAISIASEAIKTALHLSGYGVVAEAADKICELGVCPCHSQSLYCLPTS